MTEQGESKSVPPTTPAEDDTSVQVGGIAELTPDECFDVDFHAMEHGFDSTAADAIIAAEEEKKKIDDFRKKSWLQLSGASAAKPEVLEPPIVQLVAPPVPIPPSDQPDPSKEPSGYPIDITIDTDVDDNGDRKTPVYEAYSAQQLNEEFLRSSEFADLIRAETAHQWKVLTEPETPKPVVDEFFQRFLASRNSK